MAISTDNLPTLNHWAKELNASFPLLSDFNKDVSAAYGVLFEELIGLKGVAKRAAFVIGKDGVVLYSESSDDPKQLPNFESIKAALA